MMFMERRQVVPFLLAACFLAASSSRNSLSHVDAFATPWTASQRSTKTSSRTPSWLSVAVEKENRLTDADEEILFGGSAERRPPFPAAHRTKDRFGNILSDKSVAINPLDHASDPLVNKLRTMRDTVEACPQLWKELATHCPEKKAILDEHLCDETVDLTFGDMWTVVQKSAAVFSSLGVSKGTKVAILGENSARWLQVDHGIQLAGGISAVRGADAPPDELRYIYEHSDSAGIAVLQGPKLLQKLAKDATAKGMTKLGLRNDKHGAVQTVLLMHREKKTDEEIAAMASQSGVRVHVFADLLKEASPLTETPSIGRDNLATIVYTSGTTGSPKGVMLSHGNLLHQTGHRLAPSKPYETSEPLPGDTMVSILPVWHITERAFEMWMFGRGCNVVYSSIRTLKNDLAKHSPEWMVLVPRVLEKIASGIQAKFSSGSPAVKALSKFFTSVGNRYYNQKRVVDNLIVSDIKPGPLERIAAKSIMTALAPLHAVGNKLVWSKVRDGFGGNLKTVIAGGSALAGSLETFYETAGVTVCVGYGLTECSPLISFRRTDQNLITAGCAGIACLDTELRVVDPESKHGNGPRLALPDGEAGVVIARGPQIMKGYYKNPEATAQAIDADGWFDTGDLGRINPSTGDLILTGRAKDTIVLSNGENIEPIPIEDAVLGESPLIDQVMLTGQDGRRLIAITALSPSALAEAGFLEASEASTLQAAMDKVSDPKVTSVEECADELKLLQEASKRLRQNKDLKKSLEADAQRASKNFRSWEKVSDIYPTLEPFAMSNGQLTQSYKVKRASVLERYQEELPK
jgi:long-chain acyl-CoA synthetase